MASNTNTGRYDVLGERVTRMETRVDAVEARVTRHDDVLDDFTSKVGDAQTTAGAVLARLDDLTALRDDVVAVRETQAAQGARLTIVLACVGAVGVVLLGVLARLVAG